MLDDLTKGIITIIRSAVRNESGELSESFDISKAADILKKHNVAGLALDGMMLCKADKNSPALRELKKAAYSYLIFSEYQMKTAVEVMKRFESENIDFMPLKGLIIKSYYKKPENRTMSDADILIRPEQYEHIRALLTDMGFEEKEESDHEYNWMKGKFHLELHKYLIPSYNKDYFEYYGDGWKNARKTESCRYEMSDEDMLIYVFTHFAKHYRDAGIGIKHLVDIYLLTLQENMDSSYIKNELTKLRLYEFYKNILKVNECWFENGVFDEKSEFITRVIIGSGAFGSVNNSELSYGVKISNEIKNGSVAAIKRKLEIVFPPLGVMVFRFPLLTKIPLLLPFFWVIRIVQNIPRIGRNTGRLKAAGRLNKDNIEKYKNELKYVGLEFNF